MFSERILKSWKNVNHIEIAISLPRSACTIVSIVSVFMIKVSDSYITHERLSVTYEKQKQKL